jgi:SAM-dependent methyltransferase
VVETMPPNCGALRTPGERNMAATIPILPPKYHAAASHYLAGRPPYAPRLIERVAAMAGLSPGGRVLDLGCGPGQLALAFAQRGAEVLAVDPEPEMLRVARDAAGSALIRFIPIRFMQGSSDDLGPAFGRFHLVVMGRSFHWMDRVETLRRLDGLIESGGAVALFGDAHPELPTNAWRAAWREVLGRYGEPDGGRPHYASGWGSGWVRHEAFLLDSAFCRLDSMAAIERRQVPVATLVERALSQSTHSQDRLGDRVEMLSEDLVRAMGPFTVGGMITEVVETYALIGTRGEAA